MKYIVLIALLCFLQVDLFAQTSIINGSSGNNVAVQSGIGLGSVIAVVTSWSRNESILWAILHGVLGWLYVIYFAITRDKQNLI